MDGDWSEGETDVMLYDQQKCKGVLNERQQSNSSMTEKIRVG